MQVTEMDHNWSATREGPVFEAATVIPEETGVIRGLLGATWAAVGMATIVVYLMVATVAIDEASLRL